MCFCHSTAQIHSMRQMRQQIESNMMLFVWISFHHDQTDRGGDFDDPGDRNDMNEQREPS